MEFHFFGTGAGVPSIQRNVSAVAVRLPQGIQWLFDCGEATQHQILQSAITLTKIERIFISHLHGDHIFGLPGLLGSRSFQGAESPLTIYGPKGLNDFIQTSLNVSRTHLRYPLHIVEVKQGMLFETNDFIVDVLELDHVMPCFGYRMKEQDKPGTLQVERLRELGITPGPIFQKIKTGQNVRLDDGRVINGKDFVGPTKRGRTIVVAGDTRPTESMVEFAFGADILVHEATFREDKQEHAAQFGHATVREAAALAKRANVKTLILTHISSRYSGEEMEIEKEARSIFPATLLAHDHMVHSV
ncbi:ribonuclease Z [Halalkalibacter urbisdiaboli]|uniref:ribonuclease Z n=1 Tax=Halalkalibacter urbisdiaboli TaxID=1960589 RepID=UPI000B445A01|nr:ribonuclease Z [Halalkalibacter urbisdiaboli]